MKISCLMPTYNRPPGRAVLLEEAVECFLRQDYWDKELIICNDTPGQELKCDVTHACTRVRVLNVPTRFPTLSDKLRFMIEEAEGSLLCRWDDDDISLPRRLSYSARALATHPGKMEWRSTNYWYNPVAEETYHYINGAGNTHCMGLWHRDILPFLGDGGYPPKMSGWEDQEFNRMADETIFACAPEELRAAKIFYIYRWGSSPVHLSGHGGGPAKMQGFYDEIGKLPIEKGVFEIRPRWRAAYSDLAAAAAIRHERRKEPGHAPVPG